MSMMQTRQRISEFATLAVAGYQMSEGLGHPLVEPRDAVLQQADVVGLGVGVGPHHLRQRRARTSDNPHLNEERRAALYAKYGGTRLPSCCPAGCGAQRRARVRRRTQARQVEGLARRVPVHIPSGLLPP